MDIEITSERDISPQQDREILELQYAAFPETTDFIRQRWCVTPLGDDVWFGLRRDGLLIASVRLVTRRIRVAEKELYIGGVANVCSHPDVRGTGAGKAVMQSVREFFLNEGEFDFGLLFCGRDKQGFYTRFGWHEIDNVIVYEGADGTLKRREPGGSEVSMVCPGRMTLDDWPTGEIDLNGPAW